MNFEDFVKLGFNKNEAIVYVALAKFSQADARQLIKEIGFHKNIVYDNLEKLMDRGLVSHIVIEGRKVFKIEPAETLVGVFEAKEKEAAQQIDFARKLAEDIKRIRVKPIQKHESTMFQGIAGVKQVLNDQLISKQDYVSFGAPQESTDILGVPYWRNYRLRQKEFGAKGKLLFNESLKEWSEEIPKTLNEVRFLKNFAEPLTQTIVYGNRTAIIVWTEKPTALLIENEDVAKSYREFFNALWEEAKK